MYEEIEIVGSGAMIGIEVLSWKCGCVGIGRRRSQRSRSQPANCMGNTVEPGDEKTRAKTMDGKKKGFPEKMFFYISSSPCPRI